MGGDSYLHTGKNLVLIMQVSQIQWSETEEKIAKKAIKIAKEREIAALLDEVRQQAIEMTEIDNLWHLHDFLSARRYDIDGKYDYDYPTLVFVFARLLKEKWLHLDELKGLNPEMVSKISALSRM